LLCDNDFRSFSLCRLIFSQLPESSLMYTMENNTIHFCRQKRTKRKERTQKERKCALIIFSIDSHVQKAPEATIKIRTSFQLFAQLTCNHRWTLKLKTFSEKIYSH
jgi:hypothetical protein